MVTREAVLQALKKIIDPDLREDIVTLGFIRNMDIADGAVSFDINLTTPACPIKSEFEQRARDLVGAIPGVTGVNVKMTAVPRTSPAGLPQTGDALSKVGAVIAVSSCKGGVGKSTIAALMAIELAQRGYRVGLVDADIHGPSVPSLFNLRNVPVYTDEKKQIIPIERHGLKLMSFGFLLGDAPAVMRGPMVTRYIQQILHGTAWGELDYLFIDMPPGTGDVQLTITQSVRLSGAVIVTTRQALSLADVSRGILMFERTDVPILGLVENMAYFLCDSCDKKHFIFGGEKAAALQERFGLETLAEVPLLPQFTSNFETPLRNEFIMGAVDLMVRALGKQSIQQKQVPGISFDKEHIHLTWPDGTTAAVAHRDLRLSCRCAVCVNELTGEQILKAEHVRADIAPEKITPLGNYAVGIEWNDGHSSGIYPYKTIRSLNLAKNKAPRG